MIARLRATEAKDGCGGGAGAGEGRIHECLQEHMEYLTPPCASEEVSAVGAASCRCRQLCGAALAVMTAILGHCTPPPPGHLPRPVRCTGR